MTTVNLINPFMLSLAAGGAGISVGGYVSTSIGTLDPPWPADVQEGDLLIMRVGSSTINSNSEDAGWQTIVSSNGGTGNFAYLAYVIVGPSLPVFKETQSGTRLQANITRYRLPSPPVLVASSGAEGGVQVSSTPSITIPGDATRVLVVAASAFLHSAADVSVQTSFTAADMPNLSPVSSFAPIDTELPLSTERWLAEGAISSTRLGQARSMHGFSAVNTSPPASTGEFSNTFAVSGTATAMATAVFKY